MNVDRPHAVYRLFSSDNTLLYVGCTFSLLYRLKQHEDDKIWASDIKHISVEWFRCKKDALIAEANIIRAEKPEWNVKLSANAKTAFHRKNPSVSVWDRSTWVDDTTAGLR